MGKVTDKTVHTEGPVTLGHRYIKAGMRLRLGWGAALEPVCQGKSAVPSSLWNPQIVAKHAQESRSKKCV